MIELRHLTYFRTVAETLHFGRAAELLHISQPPLTRQIAGLERDLGVLLFDRSKRNVQLTAAGEHFYRDTTDIFTALERARRNAVSANAGRNGSLLVGFMMSSAYNILPAVTRHFSADYPDVDMRLTEYVPNLLAVDVKDGHTDVALMYRPEDCSDLESRTIYAEPLVAVLPRDHALAGQTMIDVAELAHESFITFPRAIAPVEHDMIVNHCLGRGFRPRIRLETNLQQTIVNLVGEGLGVALVPTSMRAMHLDTTVFIALKAAPVVQVALLWRRDNRNPCVQSFVGTANEVWRKMAESAQSAQSAQSAKTTTAPPLAAVTPSGPAEKIKRSPGSGRRPPPVPRR